MNDLQATRSAIEDPDLRFPIGEFEPVNQLTPEQRMRRIAQLQAAPLRMELAVRGLGDEQLDTAYRPGGWTVRQVVHHVPDSHMNGYIRMKWALTEDEPVIKPYDQARWADLVDSEGPVEPSLALLDAIHQRWASLLLGMTTEQFATKLNHPEVGLTTLDFWLAEYVWHGKHHTAHITSLRERMGWR